MPIFHLYMSEAGLVVPNEAATDLGELTERMIMAGAQLRTFAARETALLTPAYWGDERKNDYLLMMKANPNAARLHILPRAIGGVSMQTHSVNQPKQKPATKAGFSFTTGAVAGI